MLSVAHQAILGMGAFFLLLGVILIIWNRREKARYYDSILLTRRDIKESWTRDPERPWLGAWQIGGKISLVLGVVLLIIAGVLWLTG
ncbi:MAG: hypothetical protein ACNA7X_04240 [Dehalococcoidia bacterium]